MTIARTTTISTVIYCLVFAISTVFMIFLDNYPAEDFSKGLKPLTNTIYAWHLACWMILGMTANYLWDHLKAGKSLTDIEISNLLLPLLVSPIVFFGIWSFIPKSEGTGVATVSLSWPFVAFQNGFFWQVVFSKAGPIQRTPPQ